MNGQFWSTIISAVLGAIAAITVCLINNHYKKKADDELRNAEVTKQIETIKDLNSEQLREVQKAYTEQISSIKDDYSEQVLDLKTSFTAKLQELHSVVDSMLSENKHSYELIKLEIKVLSEKQDKYNHLQERTAELETRVRIQDEKFKMINPTN